MLSKPEEMVERQTKSVLVSFILFMWNLKSIKFVLQSKNKAFKLVLVL